MTPTERKIYIIEKITRAFSPQYLNVIDESDDHLGHQGAMGGASHFAIEIDKACFHELSTLKIHQAIYGVLTGMIPHEIHALRIVLMRE
jgi:BolA family transcriptional regulator, general stress-responsive regulator